MVIVKLGAIYGWKKIMKDLLIRFIGRNKKLQKRISMVLVHVSYKWSFRFQGFSTILTIKGHSLLHCLQIHFLWRCWVILLLVLILIGDSWYFSQSLLMNFFFWALLLLFLNFWKILGCQLNIQSFNKNILRSVHPNLLGITFQVFSEASLNPHILHLLCFYNNLQSFNIDWFCLMCHQ